MLAGMSRRLTFAIALAAALLFAATFLTARAAAVNVNLFGGEGSQWVASDTVRTANGQPTGLCTPGPGDGMVEASAPFGGDAFDFASLVWIDNVQLAGTLATVTSNEAIFSAVVRGARRRGADEDPRAVEQRHGADAALAQEPRWVAAGRDGHLRDQHRLRRRHARERHEQRRRRVHRGGPLGDHRRRALAGGDPANTTVLYGPDNPPVPASSVSSAVFECSGTQGVLGNFSVTIPPDGMVTLMWLQQISPSSQAAATRAPAFDATLTPASPLTEGMSSDEYASLVNWSVVRDSDEDGVLDPDDDCPQDANPEQEDNDGDGLGDACDPDDDDDTVSDRVDNCEKVPNTDQANNDADAFGDACDPDDDNDGVADEADNCHLAPNSTQRDSDEDGIGDACDGEFDSTAGKATGGGFLATGSGKLNLSVSARSDDGGPSGTCEVRLGKSRLSCVDVDGYFESPTSDRVVLVGDAVHDGVVTRYRIELEDLGEPGRMTSSRSRPTRAWRPPARWAAGTSRFTAAKRHSSSNRRCRRKRG